jgi:hypothetical protein
VMPESAAIVSCHMPSQPAECLKSPLQIKVLLLK